ncbi:CDP-glycerol glycerophosphotransferase family protein [Oceanobacillus caeni]|uniref:CDP-glycerol glycerophosphotransferase family protein n=1 Tax=Oceanobacillus caeni TaxID=405946 RepID=UPI001957FE0F
MIQNISTDINWNIYLTTLYGDIVEENRLDFQISMKNNLAINKIKVSQPKNNLEDYSKSQISVEGLRNDSNSILFNIKSSEFLNAKNIVFYIKRRKSKEKFILQVEKECSENKTQIKIPIGQLNEIINYTSRWDLYLELHYEGFKTEKRIGLYYRNSTSISKKCTDFFNVTKTIGVSVYITNDNEVSFYFSTKEQYTNSIYHTDLRLVNFKWKGETISFTARLKVKETNNFHVESVLLRNRKDKEQIIKAPIDREVQKENNSRVVKISMNLNNEEFEQFYWDFFLELCIDGDKKKLVRVKNNNYLIRRKLKYKLFKFNIKRNNYILYPYLTQNDCLSLTYREMGEYEAPKYKVNEYFAYYIYILFYWYFKAKPTWLIYEKFSETAQDNSFYFFKYCYENHYDKKVYYVIKKDSPDARNLQPYKGRVVYFMSIKHLILLLGSNLLVASETKGHSYAWRVNKGKVIDILNKKRYVFLQHGVLGLKIIDNIFKPNSTNGAELFVVSSKFEKDIVKKHLGYDDNNIIVTGLARWDAITAQTSHNKQKEIFLMPTWRNWLEETEVDTFLESDYYKEYSSLLQSKDLAKELDRNNIILNFYLHPKFKPFIEDFKSYSPNIRIINFGEEKINDLIMRASLLITDYSSVAWEMYYQKKPVLFFHFDLNKYIDKQGSYMDLKKDLFGDVAYNSHELTIKILAYIKNGFQEDNRFSKNRKDYFEYVDNHNSKRIYNEIIKREKELLNNSTKLSDKLKDSYLIRYLWNKYNKKPLIYNMGYRLYNRLK